MLTFKARNNNLLVNTVVGDLCENYYLEFPAISDESQMSLGANNVLIYQRGCEN